MIYSIPCPRECICKPIHSMSTDNNQMSLYMDCTKTNGKLIYQAEQWSLDKKDINYALSIDLSNSLSLKEFTNQTINLTGFNFFIHTLSLTNQDDKFLLTSNSFYSPLYEKLETLNLSSCCSKQIPNECPELFRPLKNLITLDLSGSNMYKKCLNKPGM